MNVKIFMKKAEFKSYNQKYRNMRFIAYIFMLRNKTYSNELYIYFFNNFINITYTFS